MSDQINLRASTGRKTGSRESRRLRREGEVPAIIYGRDVDEPILVSVDHHDLKVALSTESGTNVVINLEVEGGDSVLTMPRIIERHPYRNLIRHVDFVTVSLTETVEAEVAVHLEGVPAGVEDGGVLSQPRGVVSIEALPTQIPNYIEVDVSHLELNDVLRIADLPVIEGVEYLDDPDATVASLTIPRATIEDEAAEEAAELLEAEELAEGEEPEGEDEGESEGGEDAGEESDR